MTTEKVCCDEYGCNWHGFSHELLRAPNPFEDNDELIACPECKQMRIMEACDEPDCWESTTCGTPTETGYRRTCSKHAPKRVAKCPE